MAISGLSEQYHTYIEEHIPFKNVIKGFHLQQGIEMNLMSVLLVLEYKQASLTA